MKRTPAGERQVTKDEFEEIERIVGRGKASRDPVDLVAHSYDAAREAVLPSAVAWAADAEQVSRVLAFCNRSRIPVTPRGAATGRTGGAIPSCGGLVLDLSRMNRIVEISPADMIARVKPGVIVGHFQEKLEAHGLFYPPDPASSKYSTMGGNVAECAGGLRAVKYGVTRDYVLALEVVLPTGEILHTGRATLKSVTGYDLTRLFTGSEGTLGIFTEITVRLLPLPESVRAVLAQFDDAAGASRLVDLITQARLLPRALEFMDRGAIDAVLAHAETDVEIAADARAALLVEFDGREQVVEEDARTAEELARSTGAVSVIRAVSDEEREELWSLRRAISPALYTMRSDKISEDICVARSKIIDIVRFVERITAQHGVAGASYGHAGDGNLHVNVCFDKDKGELPRAQAAVEEIMREAVRLGGTISGEHGIGTSKREFLSLEVQPAELAVMKKLKRLFDPNGILNPGKIFSGEGLEG